MSVEWFEIYEVDNVWYLLLNGIRALGPYKEYRIAFERGLALQAR